MILGSTQSIGLIVWRIWWKILKNPRIHDLGIYEIGVNSLLERWFYELGVSLKLEILWDSSTTPMMWKDHQIMIIDEIKSSIKPFIVFISWGWCWWTQFGTPTMI